MKTQASQRRRNIVFTLVVAGIAVVLLLMPDLYQSPYAQDEERVAAVVTEADNGGIMQFGIVKAGSQRVMARITEGRFAGREVEAHNDLLGKMESDKMFRKGDPVFVLLTTEGDAIVNAVAYDHIRTGIELGLVLLFAALLVGYTGWSGLRAMLSFVFAILVMWKVMLPCILRGADPVFVSLAVIVAIAGVTLFMVAGLTRIGLVAWLGSLLGIALTACLAMLLFPPFLLHGAVQPFSETLLYSGFADLDLGRIFISAIFLGASGAVIDVSIDVAAAMGEVAAKRPDLTARQLTRSGFIVGRSMVSTMVTTLLMAYMSGSMALLMVLLSKGIPASQIINLNFIAAELLKTVVGSFGLVAVAPFTALIGGPLFVTWRRAQAPAPAPQDEGFDLVGGLAPGPALPQE